MSKMLRESYSVIRTKEAIASQIMKILVSKKKYKHTLRDLKTYKVDHKTLDLDFIMARVNTRHNEIRRERRKKRGKKKNKKGKKKKNKKKKNKKYKSDSSDSSSSQSSKSSSDSSSGSESSKDEIGRMAQSLQPGWRNKGGYDPPPAMKDGGGSDQLY